MSPARRCSCRTRSRAERAKFAEADDIVDLLGLGRYADRQIGELSTGTRRIAELACLLALGSSVLCLDEPTAGVAQRETEALAPLLVTIRQQLGAAMIVIEHDMPFITSISDHMYCLEAGRVIAQGAPDAVRNDPLVIASYLGTDVRAIERSGATTAADRHHRRTSSWRCPCTLTHPSRCCSARCATGRRRSRPRPTTTTRSAGGPTRPCC